MKKNNMLRKMVVTIVFLCGQSVWAQQVPTDSGGKPIAPSAPNCGTDTSTNHTAYTTCLKNYSNQTAAYNSQLAAYNLLQNPSSIVSGSIATQQNQTAAGTLNEVQKKNNTGKILYQAASLVAAGIGTYYLVTAATEAASCPYGPTCGKAGPDAVTGAGFLLTAAAAQSQSDQHAAAETAACNASNQVSSSQQNCSSTTAAGSSVTSTSSNPNGAACTDPSTCNIAGGSGLAPIKTNNGGNASGLAGGGSGLSGLQPDGSVKLPNGKTITPSDFSSAQALGAAAGLSPSQAQSVLDTLNGSQNPLSKLGDDAKDLLKSKKSLDAGLGAGGGGDNVVTTDKGLNSGKTYADKLDAAAKDKDADRKPSSEGLAKDFNGELIGVAGDDIFLMMNRRYKLKNDQDNFIGSPR